VDKKRMFSKEQRVRNGERIKAVENNIELHYLSRKTFFYNLDLSSHLLFIFSKYPSSPRNKYDPEMHLLRCFSVFCGFLFLKKYQNTSVLSCVYIFYCFLSVLQAISGIPPIQTGYNPATWVLEVTTAAVEERINSDFADIYKNSAQFRCLKCDVY
jgi:hypothetical protein